MTTARRADALFGPALVDATRVFSGPRLLLEPRVERLRFLDDGWDGYKAVAPMSTALRQADRVLSLARDRGLESDRVRADVSGGVACYFFTQPLSRHRFVEASCDNDGDIVVLFVDRETETSEAFEVVDPRDFKALLPKVEEWIR